MSIPDPASRAGGLARRGIELLFGIGVPAEPCSALDLLREADALGGAPDADYALAMIALGNVLLPCDAVSIHRWLVRSAQRGFSPALRSAAVAFGRSELDGAQAAAVWCLERAVEQGDAVAAALLAHRLQQGYGTGRDPVRAQQLAMLAVRAGVVVENSTIGAEGRRSGAAPPTPDAPGIARDEPDWTRLHLSLTPTLGTTTLLCESPGICRVDDLLNVEECRLLRYCGSRHLKRSLVVDPLTGEPLSAGLRTSRDANFVPSLEDVSLRLIQLRFAAAAGSPPLSHLEPLVVLHYAPGEQYRPHRDYLSPSDPGLAGPGRQRVTTVCCYLNEGMQGGATVFPKVGVRVQPRQGSAVVFANLGPEGQPDPNSLHAGEPVGFGEKWLATSWIRQGPIRAF
ncbi:MAG: 2OG-Fe(II) oxygenase [Xanthomonadaceae bacterium]|nr:2OG-Fe(II) oxygenase [Xanthomonadaceae bacterium]